MRIERLLHDPVALAAAIDAYNASLPARRAKRAARMTMIETVLQIACGALGFLGLAFGLLVWFAL